MLNPQVKKLSLKLFIKTSSSLAIGTFTALDDLISPCTYMCVLFCSQEESVVLSEWHFGEENAESSGHRQAEILVLINRLAQKVAQKTQYLFIFKAS